MTHYVTFTNPANSDTYTWPTNPDYNAEQQQGIGSYQIKQRDIERTSNTGNVGATRQQGDDGPFILSWQFSVYTRAHETALWTWYELCKTQSIYLTDFDEEEYEGQIIEVARTRQGAGSGPGDVRSQGYYGIFIVSFEAWRFISGPLADAGVGT